MRASYRASLSSDDSSLEKLSVPTPRPPRRSLPVTARLTPENQLIVYLSSACLPRKYIHFTGSQATTFLSSVVFPEPRKFPVPDRHLSEDLLKTEWLSCANIPGTYCVLLSVMFILQWLEFHSDFIPWNRLARRKDQKNITCIPLLHLRGEWGGECYVINGTLPKEGIGYSTGRLGPV